MLFEVIVALGSIHYSVLVVLILLSVGAIPPWRARTRVAEAAEVLAVLAAVTSLPYCVAFAMEAFIAAYSGNEFEQFALTNRTFGPYAWIYWVSVIGNCILPHAFWAKGVRSNHFARLAVATAVFGALMFEYWMIKSTSSGTWGEVL